jgi:superfamily I DNA/RNA helicase
MRGEPKDLPFPEFPGEDAISRTRRLLAVRPDLVDDLAYRVWLDERDERSSEGQRAVWAALPESERQEWYDRAAERREAYWAMTPAERKLFDAGSLTRTLRRNDRAWRDMQAPVRPTGGTS